jgi:ribosomal protein S18 acetylase RimI-like enzyme
MSVLNSMENYEPVEIVQADLAMPEHQKAVLAMTEAYASDPMGNGQPLKPQVHNNLIQGLREHPTTLIFLAFMGETPVGIANCFLGFSTFAAKPLINIHDLCVLPASRGQGTARKLLEAVEQKARELGCCKVTLEVLENNHRALKVYEAAGFAQSVYTEEAGGALFFDKKL